MRLAVLPSNQHRNIYAGDPDPAPGPTTEEMWATRACRYATEELQRHGHEVRLFWIPGAGTSNVDELVRMCDQMLAWRPDKALSLHSNTGSVTGRHYSYPLVCRSEDVWWGDNIGANFANRTGFVARYPTVRSELAFSRRLLRLGGLRRGVLLEVGQHNISADAAFNYKYAPFLGIMAARAFLQESWHPVLDDPVTVLCPPGQERWSQPDITLPQPPSLYFSPGGRVLALVRPYMQGGDVEWLQKKLNTHYDGTHGHFPMEQLRVDGIYGPKTEARVRVFQSQHWYWGRRLVVDGVVGDKTWAKLKSI